MINSTLCYIERGDDYLMLHRVKKENDTNHDKWIGVGGKIEAGETADECLLREVREETGLTLTSWKKRGIVYFDSTDYEQETMHLYTADAWDGNIIDCDEGELVWVDKHKLTSLALWEGDKIFLRLIEAGANFFSLTVRYKGDKLVGAVLNGEKII